MYVSVFYRKYCLRLMNRLNSLKHEQYFDANNSSQKKEKDKRKRKYSVCNFTELCHMPEERQK